MHSRLLTGLAVAAALFSLSVPASAFSEIDPDGIYTGGRPIGRGGSGYPSTGGMFSSSPIARTTVSYLGNHAPGTVIINTGERRLYYVLGEGRAIRYGIGVGRVGFTWSGVKRVTAKKEWPSWTPPASMLRRRPDLPRHMKGGIENPLGARAMYLGSSLYRIHGSNEPDTIGQAVSSGCFRMTNEDVVDLYERVRVGTTVIVR
jgi:lipoprotein-anchoring transpeptidase ErfK/SrfK